MHGADARTSLHGNDHFRHQRHVDHHPIAALNALGLQRVREAADLLMQLGVGQLARIARLAFEDDRGFIAALGEMHVEAVMRDV